VKERHTTLFEVMNALEVRGDRHFMLIQINDPQMDTGMQRPVCLLDPSQSLSISEICSIMDEMSMLEVRIPK